MHTLLLSSAIELLLMVATSGEHIIALPQELDAIGVLGVVSPLLAVLTRMDAEIRH